MLLFNLLCVVIAGKQVSSNYKEEIDKPDYG